MVGCIYALAAATPTTPDLLSDEAAAAKGRGGAGAAAAEVSAATRNVDGAAEVRRRVIILFSVAKYLH